MSTLMNAELATAGPALFDRMMKEFDFGPIVWTMTRYNPSMSDTKAGELLESFLQWFSLIPLVKPGDSYVMLRTDVEEGFHSFVLNTRLYEDFSRRFLGFFFHHDPATQEDGPEAEDGIRFTVELLEQNFGERLSSSLKDWRRQLNDGSARVACVNCNPKPPSEHPGAGA